MEKFKLVLLVILLVILVLIHGSAKKLTTARNIALTGVVKGNANFDGSNDVTIETTQANIAVLTGTLESGQAIINSFPEGFTKENCVIVATMFQNPSNSNGTWASGTNFNTNSYTTGGLPAIVYMQNNGIVIQSKNIILTNEQSVGVYDLSVSFKYKIVLMKIS